MQPTQENIDFVKAQFPDRAVYAIDALAITKRDSDGKPVFTGEEEEVLTVLMTAPLREEYKMFVAKMIEARETKDESDKLWRIRGVIENAAVAQIRWPDRDTVKAAFNARPEMVDNFAGELQRAAGSNIELRSKKV